MYISIYISIYILKCQTLYAINVATIHLQCSVIQFFEMQEPGSPYASVILHILLIAILVGLMRGSAALLASLAVQSLPPSKRILGPLKSREEESQISTLQQESALLRVLSLIVSTGESHLKRSHF